jgi:copper resistance protein D
VTGFVDVVLRGLGLVAQALAIGGVAFVMLVLRPTAGLDTDLAPLARRALRIVTVAAVAVVLVQVALVLTMLLALDAGQGWPVAALARTGYFGAAVARIAAAVTLAVFAWLAARRPVAPALANTPRPGPGGPGTFALTVSVFALVLTGAWTSHAAARLEGRAFLVSIDTLHQLAAGVWIGGLGHLIIAALRRRERPWLPGVLERFSTTALVSVAALVAAGLGLTLAYVDGVRALVGTSYGIMVLTKVVILGGLSVLGALNFLAIRRRRATEPVTRVRPFVEVELGLGLTALFVAASLTSLPVAADVRADRATLREVATRLTPRLPSVTSPPIEALPVGDRDAPRTDADRAWSEYNHHMAGLFVLLMGVLATLHVSGRATWARHWPLVFLGLAAFLLIRDDPGAWPLGPLGFWESMRYPEVVQHRIFVALVVVFGIFEWRVRAGGRCSSASPLVFPLLCAVGGALLLAHSHASLNLKDEFLTEVTHAPLGLLGIVVGWGRWLELRLPPADAGLPARLSAWSLALVGALLLLYRES